jgi:hypothetical protein
MEHLIWVLAAALHKAAPSAVWSRVTIRAGHYLPAAGPPDCSSGSD